MARDTRKADIKASLRGIARALNSSMDNVSEELLPEKLASALGAPNKSKPSR